MLRDVLDVVIEGSKRAVRMRTQGRSSARGRAPEWIEATTDYSVELKPGSTVLDLLVPTLIEAAPDTFGQGELFPEVDPELSSFYYFSESLAAAVAGDTESPLFDRGLLEVFRRLDRAFDGGADVVTVENGRDVQVRREQVQEFVRLEARIPPPQYVRVAGRLDAIRYSDHVHHPVHRPEPALPRHRRASPCLRSPGPLDEAGRGRRNRPFHSGRRPAPHRGRRNPRRPARRGVALGKAAPPARQVSAGDGAARPPGSTLWHQRHLRSLAWEESDEEILDALEQLS